MKKSKTFIKAFDKLTERELTSVYDYFAKSQRITINRMLKFLDKERDKIYHSTCAMGRYLDFDADDILE